MNLKSLTKPQIKIIFLIIFFLLTARLSSLGIYELADTTESRYASIAMRMLSTNDWITPKYFDQPFWGKPPLSFWATAISFKIFGISEFSARLPHFILMLAVATIAFLNLKKISRDLALVSCLIFVSSSAFLLLAGTVMTEASLVFGLALSMFSFFRITILRDSSTVNHCLFFIGLGWCMLAKGPVGVVICGISIAIFETISNRGFITGIKDFYQKFPIIRGTLLTTAIFLPWYWIAENKTPGFLSYFILGEHFGRFFLKSWQGDRYGHAHHQALGMIWLFFILMILPWSFYLIGQFFSRIKQISCLKIHLPGLLKNAKKTIKSLTSNQYKFYFLCWTISPLLLFSLAANIIIPYASLSVLPFSVLLAIFFLESKKLHNSLKKEEKHEIQFLSKKSFKKLMIFSGFSIFAISIFLARKGDFGKHSDKKTIEEYLKSRKSILAAYEYSPQHSTYFYSRDKIKILTSESDFNSCKNCFILVGKMPEDPEFIRLDAVAKKNNSIISTPVRIHN